MPRVFEHGEAASPAAAAGVEDGTITAARLVAFAITALIISFLVLERSSGLLEAGATTPRNELRSGTVQLDDDDEGRSLFGLTDLLPGRPVRNCIRVEYSGTVFDGVVGLRARGSGSLAPFVDVEVLVGEGGSFGRCEDFRPTGVLYQGTLAALLDAHGPEGAPLPAFAIGAARVARTFQVTFDVHDAPEAQGLEAAVDFEWSVRS